VPKPDAFYVGTAGAARPLILHRATAGGAIEELTAYPGVGVRDLVMDPQNIKHIYVVDELSRVWASFDEGLTWRNLTANLPKLLADARTIELVRPAHSRKGILVVGGLGGAFRLCDCGAAGAVWTRLGSNLPHGLVLDLRYNYKARVLVAGILGRGAWTLTNFFDGGHSTWESAATATTATIGATGADDSETATATTATPMSLPANRPNVAPRARSSASQAVAPR
jgi:hypothetical protein